VIDSSRERLWFVAVVLTLAWGIAAFGAPYRWAYVPLLIFSAALGLTGLWLGRKSSSPSVSLLVGLGSIGLASVAQMIPISRRWLATLSPQAEILLDQQNILYAVGQSPSHSLSIDPSRTQLGLTFFGAFTLLLLGTARVLRRETAKRLAGAVVILGVALASVGLIQNAMFNGKIYGFWELTQGGAVFGPFVNRNHFAGWMLMGIPVAFGYFLFKMSRGVRKPGLRNLVLWFSTKDANQTVLAGFGILVMALSLVLTLSRSGILGFFVALLIVGAITVRRRSGISGRASTLAYLAFLVIAVISWVGVDKLASRFADVDLASVNERPAIWADTVRIAKDFWLTGSGLNTYGVTTLHYQTSMPGQHLAEAHSDYLQLAAEGGLLLGVPIVLTVLAFAWEVRRRFREDVGSIWWIRMGAVIGLLAIALQSIGEFSLQMPGNAAMLAVVAGLAIHDGRRL